MLGKHNDGGYAEYIAVPARNAVPLPEEIPFEHGAILMCSSATCFHALRKARLKVGETVAVFGVGGLGMSAIQLAAAFGALDIYAVDISADKLELAKRCGAIPVNARRTDPVLEIRRLTGRRGTYDLDGAVGVIDSSPVLTWWRGKDSAWVTSREMFWYEKASRARAQGDVRLKSGATEMECDTIEFFSGPDSGLALGAPRVRDSVSRASGDTMAFHVRDGGLKRVTILNRATGEYRTEGGDSIVVAGKSIELKVANGAIDQVEVRELSSGQLIRSGRQSSAAENRAESQESR